MTKLEILQLFQASTSTPLNVFVVDTLPTNPIEYAIANSPPDCRANVINGKLYILTEGTSIIGTKVL